MRWLLCAGGLVLAAFLGSAELAVAASGVVLQPKPDGTLVLVGSGFGPGQQLEVSLGTDSIPATADTNGDFEVPTGLLTSSGPPLSITVRQMSAPPRLAHPGPPPEPDSPSPFAVLFAESLAVGARILALGAGGLGLASLAVRSVRSARGVRARASR